MEQNIVETRKKIERMKINKGNLDPCTVKIETVNLSQLRVNEANPRTISKEKFDKLVGSILVLPKMLNLRPIVIDDLYTILGGNMRYRALVAIENMKTDELVLLMSKQRDYQRKTDAERVALVKYWDSWRENPTAPIVRASELSEQECKEFIIKDNVGYGAWDMDMLANEWDNEELNDWGLDVWQDKVSVDLNDCTDEFTLPNEEKSNIETLSFVLSSEQVAFIKEQLKVVRVDEESIYENKNKNGNALYTIVKQWCDGKL